MKLYLLRHGKALQKDEAPGRPLAEKGVKEVAEVARRSAPRITPVPRVLHSEKLRARQTAEVFVREAGWAAKPEEVEGICPDDPVEPWATRLGDQDGDLLLAGHNPFMEELAATLLRDGAGLRFKTGTLACFERRGPDRWSLVWTDEPRD